MNLLKGCTIVFVVIFNATLSSAVTVEWVTVGNPGNVPDTRFGTPLGSVNYVYQIGKYEVTAGQYTEFLNAVAKDDPNALYSSSMAFGTAANIQQSGSAPNYSYSVAADWANRPVSAVSFWNAARFANWLHNGQPIGAQGPGTTEDGAYHNVGNQLLFGRNTGAKFFVPTENEWYKAAYHNKAAGIAASYFDYPTGTNSIPGKNINETTNPGNNANYYNNGYTIGSPYFRTVVGEFELSDSSYGTFDQGGNVEEWNETIMLGTNRGLRGGDWGLNAAFMYAGSGFNYLDPANDYAAGFRVAALIPEPTALLMLSLGGMMLFCCRSR
jgi:formylglycine-generating enzyme required for sulfatase activity